MKPRPHAGPGFGAPAKKSLGQHFLHDRDVIDDLLRAIDPKPGERLVEIGPGQGALTLPLLQRHGALTAIEFDRDLIAPLQAAAAPLGELRIIVGDVLRVDFAALAHDGMTQDGITQDGITQDGMIRLVGNLPYNLSSPILFKALDAACVVRDMHFMLQKEVVERMAAAPGSKVYGRLSVMLQAYCEVIPLFDVAPGAFRPPPKVESAVVRLRPFPAARVQVRDRARFADVVRAAFGQRRKTLRNALAGVCAEDAMQAAGVRPDARAEQVDVDGFVRLSNLPVAA